MAPHSSTLAWKIPWTEEPGRLQFMGSRRVGHDWVTSLSLFTLCTGEGNGNPLQCSCLENPRDRGAWWAAIYRVAQSWTRLKRLSSSSRVWDECNYAVVWAFFGIAFLWDWNENWPFPVLWPLLRFPDLLAYWVQEKSSTGIPSLPLALFIVMLPKAHLTSHPRTSGSRWVIIIPSCISGSWRSFLYSSSVYSSTSS